MLKYSIWKHAPAAQHFVESTKCLLLRDALYTCSWPRFFSQRKASNRHVWLDACIKSAFLRDKDWCSIFEAARKIVGLWGERNGGYWFGFHKQGTGVVVDYFACYTVGYFGFTCSKHVNPLPKLTSERVFRVVIPTINSHLLQTSISTDGIKLNLWKKRVGLFVAGYRTWNTTLLKRDLCGGHHGILYGRGHGLKPRIGPVFQMGCPYFVTFGCFNLW